MRPILKKAAANASTIVLWLTRNPFVQNIINTLKGMIDDYDSRAKDCQVHAVRESRASCERYQNDIYTGINQGLITNLEIR